MMTYTNSNLATVNIPSPNMNKTRINSEYNPEGVIDMIAIHHMAGNLTVEACGRLFSNARRKASSTYGIGTDGRIAQYVDEAYRPWTTSSKAVDYRAVTVEVANDGGAPDWHVSDKAIESLIKLCADVCKRNGIKKLNYTGDSSGNLVMHKWYIATACPGPYLASKFKYIADEVNKLLAAEEEEKKEDNTKEENKLYYVQVGAYGKKENAEAMVAKLKSAGFNAIIKTDEIKAEEAKEVEEVKEEIKEEEPVTEPIVSEIKFDIGDKVKIKRGAPVYGTTTEFQPWVYNSTLYVRDIYGSRAVVSTLAFGAITGAVDTKYLIKI